MNKKPKKLIRMSVGGKRVIKHASLKQGITGRKPSAWLHIQIPGGPNIHLNPTNPYAAGPFKIETVTVHRRINGEIKEVKKRALLDSAGMPIKFGPRKWLDKQLKKYEMGYVKYLMTRGTKAEGL